MWTSLMPYVLCPKCGDPAPIPQPPEKQVTCSNSKCRHDFRVGEGDVHALELVSYDNETKRYKLETYGP